MTLTVDVDEVTARLPELVAEVEAGRDVIIQRGSAPFARLSSAAKETDVRQVIAEIRSRRRELPPTTPEEISQWRDEERQ